jgi:hypothetical protein
MIFASAGGADLLDRRHGDRRSFHCCFTWLCAAAVRGCKGSGVCCVAGGADVDVDCCGRSVSKGEGWERGAEGRLLEMVIVLLDVPVVLE